MTILDYVMMLLGAISLLVWLILFFAGIKHAPMFDVLDEKEFRLKGLYGMGHAVLEAVHYSYKSKKDRILRQQLEVLYGEKYCEYYLRVVHAGQVTVGLTMLVVSFAFYGLSADLVAFVVLLMLSAVLVYYMGTRIKKKIETRSEELMRDFSDVVAKLALLTNAGLILKEAWQEVAFAGEGTIYDEMKMAVEEMRNGIAEVDAIYNFGSRCMLPEIKKFTATIVQGITKGNSELSAMLQSQSKEVWQLKKQLVHRAAEKAASKLLIPICIMFIGILILIIIPIFSNLGL